MESVSRNQEFARQVEPVTGLQPGRAQAHVELDAPAQARVMEPPDLSPRVERESVPMDLGPQEPWKVAAWAKAVAEDPNLLALDTETTGLGGAAVEVGVVDAKGATVYHAYVQPLEPIHPMAAKVHGLTEERLAELGARPWTEVAAELREVLRGRPIAAYSDSFFDKAALEKTDSLAGTPATAPGAEWVDVMRPYQTAQGDYKAMKLVEAAESLGVPLAREEAHGAIADARAAMGVLQALGRQEGPVLGPEEAYLRLNPRGNVEAFNATGARLELPSYVLNDRMGDSLAYEWPKPARAVETIQRGGFIRVDLPGMDQRPNATEPDAIFLVENDNLGDDWPAFGTYREAEDYVWEASAEIAKANVDENGVGNVPAFQGFSEREITERIFQENIGSIEKRIGRNPEPTAWLNPYTKQIDLTMGEAARGARAHSMSSDAAVAGVRAIESGLRADHDGAKVLHQLAAQEHRAFATNFNPAVAHHAFKLAALHDRAASWHQERGNVFAKPADFRTDQTTDLFYLRKFGQANPPERAETTKAIAGKPQEGQAV